MLRDSSPKLPPGATPLEPMNIGEIANPPFAMMPRPETVFKARSDRFRDLAPGHTLAPFLEFLAILTLAQHIAVEATPAAPLPATERIDQALDNGMPPLAIGSVELDAAADAAFASILATLQDETALNGQKLTPAALAAVVAAAAVSPEQRREMMLAVLHDEVAPSETAVHVLAAAAVQVHFTRLAAQLDADRLKRVVDGACPSCGSAPVSSMLVGWEGAHGTRFCTCSICATQWHVVRIKCLVCSNDKGITYQSLDETSGGPKDTTDALIMGETCGACSSYVKMMHHNKDARLDPLADDVASLALDLTLKRENWRRASVNPFLMGY
jgi:FdhE protein